MTQRAARGRPRGSKGNARPTSSRRSRSSKTDEPADPRPILLLGVGNILYGDEGLGVYVVHRLRRGYKVPPTLRIVDGGAAGWHLEPTLTEARKVFIVDAVEGTVGSIYRFGHHDMPSVVRGTPPMAHGVAVEELLRGLEERGDLPPTRIIAMGVAPTAADADHLAMGLSAEVEARLPALELVLLAELADAGVLLEPRSRPPSETRLQPRSGRGRSRHHA